MSDKYAQEDYLFTSQRVPIKSIKILSKNPAK